MRLSGIRHTVMRCARAPGHAPSCTAPPCTHCRGVEHRHPWGKLGQGAAEQRGSGGEQRCCGGAVRSQQLASGGGGRGSEHGNGAQGSASGGGRSRGVRIEDEAGAWALPGETTSARCRGGAPPRPSNTHRCILAQSRPTRHSYPGGGTHQEVQGKPGRRRRWRRRLVFG